MGEKKIEDQHHSINFPKLIPFLVILLALIPSFLGFFTYFSYDDYIWLHFAQDYLKHPQKIPGIFLYYSVLGHFRPGLTLFWTLGLALWGAQAELFQLGMFLSSLITALFLYKLGAFFGNRASGWLSVLVYFSFLPIAETTWIRSAISTHAEVTFTVMGVYLLLRWLETSKTDSDKDQPNKRLKFLLTGILCTIAAISFKENALCLWILFPLWKFNKKSLKLAVFLGLISIFLYLLPQPPGEVWLNRSVSVDFNTLLKGLANFLGRIIPIYLTPFLISFTLFYSSNSKIFCRTLAVISYLITFYTSRFFLLQNHQEGFFLLSSLLIFIGFVYVFIQGSSKERWLLAWIALMLAPPILFGVHTRHQVIEAIIPLALLIGLRISNFVENFSCFNKQELACYSGNFFLAIVIGWFLIFAGFTQLGRIWLKEGIPYWKRLVTASNITKEVREFLKIEIPAGATFYSDCLPGLISYPDLGFDLELNGRKDLICKENNRTSTGYIVLNNAGSILYQRGIIYSEPLALDSFDLDNLDFYLESDPNLKPGQLQFSIRWLKKIPVGANDQPEYKLIKETATDMAKFRNSWQKINFRQDKPSSAYYLQFGFYVNSPKVDSPKEYYLDAFNLSVQIDPLSPFKAKLQIKNLTDHNQKLLENLTVQDNWLKDGDFNFEIQQDKIIIEAGLKKLPPNWQLLKVIQHNEHTVAIIKKK